jgi:CHAT domain-containing protein
MTSDSKFPKAGCLVDEDLYLYISRQANAETLGSAESHLAQCADCRRHLAELLEILQPADEQAAEEIPAPSKTEVDRALAIIEEVSRKERTATRRPSHYFRWPLAAAASIAIVALSFWGLKNFYETKKSEAFFSQAEAIMNQNYVDSSPGNLRLDLPFHSTSANRSLPNAESLRQAENLFFQALAYREDLVDAHLGLAGIYLRESKLNQAREEFQKVLAIRKGNVPALIGRGVTQYEEAIQGVDPLKRRTLLEGALSDFGEALKMAPASSEALYNKIWTLFESGLHKEALQEIERYLARDSNSIWAESLKALQIRMRATQISAVKEDVRRLAWERNKSALMELARQAPYQMPEAIMSVMKQSLEVDSIPSTPGNPSSEDLRRAADTMETAYREATGDTGFKTLLAFYAGLSPPQRELKKTLDKKLQDLDGLYRKGRFTAVLSESSTLLSRYTELQDFWQVTDVHHLRGNSYYLGTADFDAAAAEYSRMLNSADRINSSALKAKALGSLALASGMKRKVDDSLSYANNLKSLAQAHNLKSLELYAFMQLGAQFQVMGQFEQSFREYSIALGMGYRLLDGLLIVEALEYLGAVADRLGRIQDAKFLYGLALQQQDYFLANRIIEPMPELTIRRLNLLFAQGDLALRCDDIVSAEKFFKESLNSTPDGMHEIKGRNRLGLAEIYLRTNRIHEAAGMVECVVSSLASGQYPEIEWQVRSLNGRLLERTGNHEEALASLRNAIEILENMRRNIHSGNLRQSFFTDRFDPFKTMVSILQKSPEENMKTLEFVDRAKSMTLREYLSLPKFVSGSRGNSADRGQRASAYPIVEYFFIDTGFLILSTRENHAEIISQKISKAELSSQIHEYLESININDQKKFTGMARRLYDELIAPIEKQIFVDPSETLILLPDGPLHLLPFAGLQDSQGHFLIEKMPIAVAPSRSVFRHCLVAGRKRPFENLQATLIDGSAGLANAQKELAYLSGLYGRNACILTSKDLSVFKPTIAHSDVVHFSGHAIELQGKPALVLRASPNGIYLDCQTIAAWSMSQSYLVNLAGCSTGIGPLTEGESPWGLIPAFLNAGAPAIIASLTPVDDASTERLSCRFYELLLKGFGKAKALQKAQIALLDPSRSESASRPQSWVPYILVGNPQ